MDLLHEKVKHKTLGIGEIISFDGTYVEIQFASKISKFLYPSAFETFLTLENLSKQNELHSELIRIKQAETDKKQAEQEARRKAEEARKAALAVAPSAGNRPKAKKSLDEMFSEDYHAAHLARQPILTYQQVEEQFGIRISGFGRGINPTTTKVVLISSISKSGGHFVYHDRWTEGGDYIYSGEGRTGDQTMTKGNLAIKNAAVDGKEIHLFVKFSPQEYYYQGVFNLVEYSAEEEKDENGDLRKEYKFRLHKVK